MHTSRLQLRNGRPKRILAVASGGGHWVQLLRLRPAFAGCRVTYAVVNRAYAADVPGERLRVVPDATRWNRLALLHLALRLLWVLLTERPDLVVSTGAAPGYFAIRLGKWFGARTIWLDSIANVETLSMAARLVRRYADLWLTQWPHLVEPGGPLYAGQVLGLPETSEVTARPAIRTCPPRRTTVAAARRSERKRILACASGGGHWNELLRLRPAFQGSDVVFATCHRMYRADVPEARFYFVADATRWDKARLLLLVLSVLRVLLIERPDVVVSTGAAPGYFALRIAKLFGARTVWVDSIANAEELSLSGQRVRPFADLFLTQWSHLARPAGPHYVGAIL